MKRSLAYLTILPLLLSACAQNGTLPVARGLDAPDRVHAAAAASAASAYRTVYTFGIAPDATFPTGTLINVGGTLYGITSAGGAHEGGTLFSVDASGKERVLNSFPGYTASYGGPAAHPSALTSMGDTLYGVTQYGGTGKCTSNGVHFGCGTLFSYTRGGGVHTLYNFPLSGAIAQALTSANGVLYGATGFYLFSSTPSGKIHILHKFTSFTSVSALLVVGSTLYGTIAPGYYAYKNGAVFASTLSGQMKPLYTFKGGTDGQGPTGNLVYIDGALYGVTQNGGSGKCRPYNAPPKTIGCGTIYSVKPSGAERIVYNFTGGSDGSGPIGGLTNVRGMLYGTTSGNPTLGGTSAASVFRITPAGALTVLHVWSQVEDPFPEGGITPFGKSLYSTTNSGGQLRRGTVFSVTP